MSFNWSLSSDNLFTAYPNQIKSIFKSLDCQNYYNLLSLAILNRLWQSTSWMTRLPLPPSEDLTWQWNIPSEINDTLEHNEDSKIKKSVNLRKAICLKSFHVNVGKKNLNLIDCKTNHTHKSINFIHFTFVPSSSQIKKEGRKRKTFSNIEKPCSKICCLGKNKSSEVENNFWWKSMSDRIWNWEWQCKRDEEEKEKNLRHQWTISRNLLTQIILNEIMQSSKHYTGNCDL